MPPDPQQQILAIAEGLGIPDPASWTWLEPGQLKLICRAIAKQAARVTDETTVVTCTCPDVCKICGGRVSACKVLGHRPADARAVKWHECPTPAALRSDRDALYALLRDFALTPAGPRADAVWERVLRVIGPVDRTGLDTDPPGVGDVERRLAEETTPITE